MRFLGIIALLITVGLIGFWAFAQFSQFEAGSQSNNTLDGSGAGRIGDPAGMIETIDMAEDAARAMETKNRIPADLLE